MTARPARVPSTDRRQQIIQAAMELFAKQGFQGTTTREIADRTHVNEAILFRHFPHKDDLYWAVIEAKCCGLRGPQELRQTLKNAATPREALVAIAEDILRRNAEDPTRPRLFLFSALENHRLTHRFFRSYIAQYYDILADYIREQIRQGNFRSMEPRLAARCFFAMVSHHYQVQELFGGRRYQKFDVRGACETMADIWLEGVRAGKNRHPGRHSKNQSRCI
jgi:TetR/AcrR family transcriptional regulator